jgi:hypothetical protein
MTVQTSASFDGHATSANAESPPVAMGDVATADSVTAETGPSEMPGESGGADASASGDEGADDGEDAAGGEAAETAGANGEAGAAGEAGKKKRRRKRKKKAPNGEAAGAARPHARPPSERSPFHTGE